MNNLKSKSISQTFFYLLSVFIISLLGANAIGHAQEDHGISDPFFEQSSSQEQVSATQIAEQPRITTMTYAVYLPLIIKPDVLSAEEQAVLDRVNEERADAGCDPLVANPLLTTAARDHSQDMADNDFTSHEGSDGSTPGERVTALGYSWNWVGENIAWGYSSANSVMNGWMNSDGHRANILNCNFREIGVGHVFDSGSTFGHYWTQVFARPN